MCEGLEVCVLCGGPADHSPAFENEQGETVVEFPVCQPCHDANPQAVLNYGLGLMEKMGWVKA